MWGPRQGAGRTGRAREALAWMVLAKSSVDALSLCDRAPEHRHKDGAPESPPRPDTSLLREITPHSVPRGSGPPAPNSGQDSPVWPRPSDRRGENSGRVMGGREGVRPHSEPPAALKALGLGTLSPNVPPVSPRLDGAVMTPRLPAWSSSPGLRRAPRLLWRMNHYCGPRRPGDRACRRCLGHRGGAGKKEPVEIESSACRGWGLSHSHAASKASSSSRAVWSWGQSGETRRRQAGTPRVGPTASFWVSPNSRTLL